MIENRRRTKTEIIYSILRGCSEGSKKTRLMYLAKLNYSVFMKYIYNMKEMNLIEFNEGKCVLTDKGKRVLELLDKYMEMYSKLNEVRMKLEELMQTES
jgi:predicted transcriptional regulator